MTTDDSISIYISDSEVACLCQRRCLPPPFLSCLCSQAWCSDNSDTFSRTRIQMGTSMWVGMPSCETSLKPRVTRSAQAPVRCMGAHIAACPTLRSRVVHSIRLESKCPIGSKLLVHFEAVSFKPPDNNLLVQLYMSYSIQFSFFHSTLQHNGFLGGPSHQTHRTPLSCNWFARDIRASCGNDLI